MKKMLLTLSVFLFSAAAFSKPVELFVTESGDKLEAVTVEVDCKRYYTDLYGTLCLDLKPGVYTLKLSKVSYEDVYVVVNVDEGGEASKVSVELVPSI